MQKQKVESRKQKFGGMIWTFMVMLALMALVAFTASGNIWVGKAMPQFTNSVSNATNTSTTGTAVVIEQGAGMNIYMASYGTNSPVSNVVAGFNFISSTNAGSIATTTYPVYITNSEGNSNTITMVYQLTAAQLKNYYSIRFDLLACSQTNVTTTLYYDFFK